MCTARPNWLSLSTTFFNKEECHKVPIPLYDILALDEEGLTVTVEPMVTVGEITRYLVPRGFTLAVTLEIADATLGGLAFGVGMTTYSHKVGLYQEAVEAWEVVLGDGSVVTATREEHTDIFHCLPWSHGSLAFLVGLKLRIIPVKPYIHMRYIPVRGQKQYCDMIRELSGANSKDQEVAGVVVLVVVLVVLVVLVLVLVVLVLVVLVLVLVLVLVMMTITLNVVLVVVKPLGRCPTTWRPRSMTGRPPSSWWATWPRRPPGSSGRRCSGVLALLVQVNHVTRWYKPWFYKHVETFLTSGEGEEYIPLREYLLRHDKAIFWVLESMIPFGNHPLFLLLLGWMLPPKPAFMKLTTTPAVRAMTFTKQVFQDIVLPINRLEEQINKVGWWVA